MKKTPILFSQENIPKLLDETKTMTRRVIMPQPHIEKGVMRWDKSSTISINMDDHADLAIPYCPYGQVGDWLWLKESHKLEMVLGEQGKSGITTLQKQNYYSYKQGFIELWDKLNAKRGYSFANNNWVWVIGFKLA